jgi:DhnA family fructose-bisphosphate aldolase class Ia
VADPVARALRLDAACVVVNLYDVEGQEHMRRESIENITALKASGEPVGMPVMIEPFVYAPDRSTGTWTVVADTGRNLALMRQAAELGADVIKADPTDDPAGYARVVTAAGVPVVVRGGGRVSDAELFRRTEDVLSNGASGLVYGRNVIQHPRPRAIIDALRALVHDGVSAEDAVTRMRDR